MISEKERIKIQTSETFLLSSLLALSGGFQDAYTYNVRDKVFSNAQTGNVVLMSQHLMQGEWQRALHYLFPVLAFALGVLVAEQIGHKYKGAKRIHWRQIIVALEIVLLFAVILGAVLLVQGTRKVPVQYAKRIVGNKQYGGARQYIPLKVNAAGVMPIIFAQAIMFIPLTLAGFGSRGEASSIVKALTNMEGFWYNFIYFLMIVAFTYFYTAITVRPTQMSEDMKRNNGFIPGVKPGKKTADYLDSIMSRITLPGSIFLGIVAIMPAFARICGVTHSFAQFFGGTSLLIMVGVVLDTLQQIESHLLMHHYDGLMKSGKLKGRTTGSGY